MCVPLPRFLQRHSSSFQKGHADGCVAGWGYFWEATYDRMGRIIDGAGWLAG